MEINKPGGFLLLMLDKLSNENTTLKNIESKFKEFEKSGIVTYDFIIAFGDDRVSLEIYKDLSLFIDVGWIKFIDFEYKLTNRGIYQIKDYELPEVAKEKFEKLFEE